MSVRARCFFVYLIVVSDGLSNVWYNQDTDSEPIYNIKVIFFYLYIYLFLSVYKGDFGLCHMV